MTTTLHTISGSPHSRRTKRRLGRGHGSGRGTYSGRGLKGQKARSGGRKGLKQMGLRTMILSIPKVRGFSPRPSRVFELRLGALNTILKDGETCSPTTLRQRHLWKRGETSAKIILGGATFERKNITIKSIKCTSSVAKQIRDLGGKIVA